MSPDGPAAAPTAAGSRVTGAGVALMLFSLPVSVSGTQAGLALAAAGATWELARGRRLPRTPLDAPVLAFLAATLASAALAADPGASLAKAAGSWRLLALYVLVLRFAEPAAFARGLRLAIPAALAAGAFGLAQHFTGWTMPGGANGTLHALVHDGRVTWLPEGGFSHYQTFANVYFVLFCLFLGIAAGGRGRALPAAAAAVSLAAVLFSYTRGVWVALLGALGLFLRAFARRRASWIAAGAAAAVALALAASPGARSRVRSMADPAGNVERLLLWETTWSMLRDRPVLGIGAGAYGGVQDRYVREEVPLLMTSTHAHNIWLQAAVEGGLAGLAAFSWLVVAALGTACTAAARLLPAGGAAAGLAVGSAAALAGFLVDGLVQNNFGDAQAGLLFWVAAAAAVVCRRAADAVPAVVPA